MSDKIISKQQKNSFTCFGDSNSMKWDSLNSAIFALTIIWAGLVFLAESYGFVTTDAWSVIFVGAGTLVLIETAARLFYPAYKESIFGHILWAGFLFWLSGWAIMLPTMIVAAGAFILYKTYTDKFSNKNN